jgi:hypothetical protein
LSGGRAREFPHTVKGNGGAERKNDGQWKESGRMKSPKWQAASAQCFFQIHEKFSLVDTQRPDRECRKGTLIFKKCQQNRGAKQQIICVDRWLCLFENCTNAISL